MGRLWQSDRSALPAPMVAPFTLLESVPHERAQRSLTAFRAAEPHRRQLMLYYAVVFFVIAIVAAILGFGGIAAGAAGIAKILFFIFLILAIVTFLRRA
jgi:uncharacterized membrane protein YtjA (UPF0391 family)